MDKLKNKLITMQWIPIHCNILDIEMVDVKIVARLEPKPNQIQSSQNGISNTYANYREKWIRRWEEERMVVSMEHLQPINKQFTLIINNNK